MNAYQIREQAREALKGKWGKGALITLAYFTFTFALGFFNGLFEEGSMMYSLIEIAILIIQVPILFGFIYSFIKLKRNEEVKAFDFLNLGFSNFKRIWEICLRVVLKMILPVIVTIVGMILIAVPLSIIDDMGLWDIMTGNVLSLLEAIVAEPIIFGLLFVGGILIIVSEVWITLKVLYYSLTTYIAYDNPNMSSTDVVNESKKIMQGNRLRLFLLSLSFIGWMIIAVFTLGIGYFWLMPYMYVALVCFYDNLLEKNKNNTIDNNND